MFKEESDVSRWLDVIGGQPSTELYLNLVEEELQEFMEEDERQAECKELIDLLWVAIGYYISLGEGYREELVNNVHYPLLFSLTERDKKIANKLSISQYVGVFLEKRTLLEYLSLKTAIFLRLKEIHKMDYYKAWDEVTRSNFSKFLVNTPEGKKVAEQSLDQIDKDRYNPYIQENGKYLLIRDKESNKILKPISYHKANFSTL